MLYCSLESLDLTDKVNLMPKEKKKEKKTSHGIWKEKEWESMCSILGQSLDFILFTVFHIFLCYFGTKKNSLNFQTL